MTIYLMEFWKSTLGNLCILIYNQMLVQCIWGHTYPIPQVHLATFKKELDHLCSSNWSTIPSQRYRMGIANFYNTQKGWHSKIGFWFKRIKQGSQESSVYLTNYHRRFMKKKGYEFLTKSDISMMFYTFPLDDENESSKLCAIVAPFGPF